MQTFLGAWRGSLMRHSSCPRLSHLGGQGREATVSRQIHGVRAVAERSVLGREFVNISLGVDWDRRRRPKITPAYGPVLMDAQRGERHFVGVGGESGYPLQQLAAPVANQPLRSDARDIAPVLLARVRHVRCSVDAQNGTTASDPRAALRPRPTTPGRRPAESSRTARI